MWINGVIVWESLILWMIVLGVQIFNSFQLMNGGYEGYSFFGNEKSIGCKIKLKIFLLIGLN